MVQRDDGREGQGRASESRQPAGEIPRGLAFARADVGRHRARRNPPSVGLATPDAARRFVHRARVEGSHFSSSRSGALPPMSESDPSWYKDAIIYELHVKAFFDSNDDGIGDFPGLIQKLDYLQDLGVTCIWLLPFYPSPLRDDGYDISDYHGVHPGYGTRKDFRLFIREAHRRGIRVITELVINHTSDQHPWFQKARRAKPGSAARDFYVWSDTDQRYA